MAWSKASPSSRGYGWKWVKLRKLALTRDKGLCQVCKRSGRLTAATEVDHILSKAECTRRRIDPDRLENLQSICNPCHIKKTIEENGGGIPRPVTGSDGWPVN